MALTVTNPGKPGDPAKGPDVKKLKKVDKDIEKINQNIQKNIGEIGQAMEKLGAKQICLLRLDMVADIHDKFDSRLAGQVDAIANALEKEDV
jgi:hypothetical protein